MFSKLRQLNYPRVSRSWSRNAKNWRKKSPIYAVRQRLVVVRRQLRKKRRSKSTASTFVSRVLTDIPAKDLKPMADAFKAQVKSGVIALVASAEGKVSIVVAVTDDLTGKISAVELVKTGAEPIGGKGGGGRPDMAQAGGTDISAMPQAIAAIEHMLKNKTKAA